MSEQTERGPVLTPWELASRALEDHDCPNTTDDPQPCPVCIVGAAMGAERNARDTIRAKYATLIEDVPRRVALAVAEATAESYRRGGEDWRRALEQLRCPHTLLSAVTDAVEVVLHGADTHSASRREAVRRVLLERDTLLRCRWAVEARQELNKCIEHAGSAGERRRARARMLAAHAAAVAALQATTEGK